MRARVYVCVCTCAQVRMHVRVLYFALRCMECFSSKNSFVTWHTLLNPTNFPLTCRSSFPLHNKGLKSIVWTVVLKFVSSSAFHSHLCHSVSSCVTPSDLPCPLPHSRFRLTSAVFRSQSIPISFTISPCSVFSS